MHRTCKKTLQLNLTGGIERSEVYIYIYCPMVTTSCDLYAPRCATSPAGTFSRVPGRGPRWHPAKYRSFTSIQMVHTHAPQQRGKWDDDENEMTVKMEWTLSNQDTKRGTQEKRERANTNTTHLARNRQHPEKARKKKKTKADGHGTRPAEEGKDGSAWTNLTKRNLSLARHAQDPTYLKGGERRNTWERGPMGD